MVKTDSPRIYVACLASYNAGILYGKWIDVLTEYQVNEEIEEMLKGSSIPDAEEFAIHDHEGFQGIEIGEYTAIDEVADIANALENHEGYVAAYKYYNSHEHALEACENHYYGYYDTKADFAWEWLESMGYINDDTPPLIVGNLDIDGVADDLMNDFFENDGHYFINC